MSYGHVYVAKIAFGAKDAQTVSLPEADPIPGPSLIIAYSHCIATATTCPRRDSAEAGRRFGVGRCTARSPPVPRPAPLTLDSSAPKISPTSTCATRHASACREVDPERFKRLIAPRRRVRTALRRLPATRRITVPTLEDDSDGAPSTEQSRSRPQWTSARRISD